MASGDPIIEQTGKAGTFGVVSGTDFSGQGARVDFIDATVVTTFTATKHTGATLVRTWPAGSFYNGPITALIVSSGFAVVSEADV